MSTSAVSSDIFLSVQTKRGGRIKGEASALGHEDEMAVASWRWGAQAASSLGAGAATSRRSYSGLTIVKALDCASTALLSALATNDEVKEAVLTMRKSGQGMQDHFLLTLKEARVTQVDYTSNDSGETQEVVTFSFRRVEVEYRRQDAQGGRGASHMFTDDILPSA